MREHARGSEQYGLLASSQAMRLEPHAIDIRVSVNPIHWFLGARHDTRSCYYFENAATEFQIQGLEVDWACVTWGADLRRHGADWSHHEFRGKTWNRIRTADLALPGSSNIPRERRSHSSSISLTLLGPDSKTARTKV